MTEQTLDKEEVTVRAGPAPLQGNLTLTKDAGAIVVFAHGSGSSRFSPRNRFVAERLNEAGLATLLLDLLTEEEEAEDLRTRELRFDIDLLAQRVAGTIDWVGEDRKTQRLAAGLFGASTGAAAALVAAATRPEAVRAVVSRGGRPDLAAKVLPRVRAAALLIVGGNDAPVIELNQMALESLAGPKQLEIVPGASHLFEEPGKLDEVARLAAEWFGEHLAGSGG